MVEVDPRIGSEIAGYRIEAVVGRVHIGVVYLARDVRLDRRVTLKLLDPALTADERFRERFLRESTLVASLEHLGIVRVYESGAADGHVYVAREYVEGVDLASLLDREGRLEPERALAIVGQLAAALDTARFARGLVHGHLDPGDVLIAPATEAGAGERVLLQGLALRRDLPPGATVADAARHLGSLDYLAPEQLEGKQVTPRSDVYALGCLLYHCLTGEPPFTGQPADVVRAHLHEPPPSVTRRRPDLPTAVNEVLRTALAKWPEERYPTCAELATAAHAALTGGKEAAPSPGIDRPFPALVPTRLEPAAREAQPSPTATDGQPATAAASWGRRLVGTRRTAIAATGLAVLFAVLVAVVVWRTGGGTGDVGAASPAPPSAGAPGGAAGAARLSAPATAGQTPGERASAARDLSAPEPTEPEPPAAAIASSEPDSLAALDRLVSFGSGSLVRIDGDGGEVAARVAIPAPALVAADSGSVWVLTERGSGGRQLVRVEQATGAVAEVFAAVVPPPFEGFDESVGLWAGMWVGLAAVGGDAFVGLGWGLYRFTPGRGAGEPLPIDRFLDGGLGNDRTLWPVAAAGSLWVRGGEGASRLLRLDPATGSVLDHLGAFDRVVAAGRGFVWALNPHPDVELLARIDTATGETVPLPWLPGWRDFVAAAGAVWASSARHDALLRLDPDTGEEIERIALAGTPGALAAGGGAVWAALGEERAVARYDLASGRLTTIDVAGVPVDLAFAAGSLWVGVTDPSLETRVVNGVRFSFARPDARWQRGPQRLAPDGDCCREGHLYVGKARKDADGADGVLFWTGFPRGAGASACAALQDREIGPSIADLAAAVAAAPGTELIHGPSDVTVAGRPAKYVELTVREDLGCDPGYFYAWDTRDWVGAGWVETITGDTIRVWIVDVDGTRLFIEAETNPTDLDLEPEIRQIVDSIRFEAA